jgi:predicted DNA-binding transcriptional regulator AlpA
MALALINRREARKRVGGISRSCEHTLIKTDPTWPQPVQISSVLTGYIEAEISAWIEARGAEREPRRKVA